MSNNSYILNIQNPCDEKWNSMQPHDRGKFCMQCSKEVIDFTKLDNKEIIQIIEESKGRICGRMSISQLNKPIEIQSKKGRSKLYKALTAMFLIGSTGSIFASSLPSTTNNLNVSKNESNYKRINLKQIKTDTLKDKIKGQVLTEFEEPIPEANIFIKELNLEIVTDKDGNFLITLPQNFQQEFVTVLISYPYFEDYETHIYKTDLSIDRKYYLKEDNEYNEEVVLTGIVVTKYVKKRWWQFWK